MDMKPLLEALGGGAGLVLSGVLVVVLVLIVWAFWQGRSVEFWPPRIGAQPGHPEAADDEAAPRESDPTSEALPVGARPDRVFDTRDALGFYQAIAPNYDQRNSVNLLATHMEVITRIEAIRAAKAGLRVLDLGGGTGQNVATYFFNDCNIRWTYVDFCPGMADQLQQHLAGRPLYNRLRVHVEDISRIHLRVAPKSHDVILLNLVLSSMPQLPDFARIATLLAPGGTLIISDINPLYTSAHPLYQARAGDGTQVAMRTHMVQPLEVVTRAREAGLQLSDMTQIGSADISYSFVAVFESAARQRRKAQVRKDEESSTW
ncbi:class I SAM-dependent methyltransferase [Streptosporangium amethystogenes]|uniref:class I SAM-dependent methyltransferase n=1 Tax=Streptosporangium amethystogenes TaxID=2002 RepID=UPI003798C888